MYFLQVTKLIKYAKQDAGTLGKEVQDEGLQFNCYGYYVIALTCILTILTWACIDHTLIYNIKFIYITLSI